MTPVIADPRLQELYATASNEMMLTQGIVSTAAQAFIAALNERLEAAERMAAACAVEHGQHDFEPECDICCALSAYRKASS